MATSSNVESRRSTRVPLDVSIEVEGKSGTLPFKGVNGHGQSASRVDTNGEAACSRINDLFARSER